MPVWPLREKSRAILVTIFLLLSFPSDSAVNVTEKYINTGKMNVPPFGLFCYLHYKCDSSPNKYVSVTRIKFNGQEVADRDDCSLAAMTAVRRQTESFLNEQCATSTKYNQSMITFTNTSGDTSCNVSVNDVDVAYECVLSYGLTQSSSRRPATKTSAPSYGLQYSIDMYSQPSFSLLCEKHYKCNNSTGRYVSIPELSLTNPSHTRSGSPCYSDVEENLKQQVFMILNNECATGQEGYQLNVTSATSACSNISFTGIQFDYACLPSPATTLSTLRTNLSGSNVFQAAMNNTVDGKETSRVTTSARGGRDQEIPAGDALSTQPPTQSSVVLIVAIAVPLSVLLVAAAAVVAVSASRKILCFKGACALKQPETGGPALPSPGTGSAYNEPSDTYYAAIAYERYDGSLPMNTEPSVANGMHEYYNTRRSYLVVSGTLPPGGDHMLSVSADKQLSHTMEPPDEAIVMVECDLYASS